jgi:hypothetical protein
MRTKPYTSILSLVLLSQLVGVLITKRRLTTFINKNASTASSSSAPPPISERDLKRRQGLFVKLQHKLPASTIPKPRLLVHLHIGKCGGTSVDTLFSTALTTPLPNRHVFIGHQHFDWSFIDTLDKDFTDVVMMLRHPVSRAVSHFDFSKTLAWTRQHPKMRKYSLKEYLHDPQEMMETRSIWFDGQGGVSWLAGTHAGYSILTNATLIQQRNEIATNATRQCLLAANHLDQTRWFGILEDIPKSMELLQHALNLTEIPTFPKQNAKRKMKPFSHSRQQQETQELGNWEQRTLASLMPQDLWLYEYGVRLFEARYKAMKTGVFEAPERPPFPKTWSCSSTRMQLDCVEGPLKGSYQRLDI